MTAEIRNAFAGRRVLLTGHTGFKGSWLSIWLNELGAEVYGYALEPDTQPNLFNAAGVERLVQHEIGDVRDLARLREALRRARPDFVLHLAAQPLVRLSYEQPLVTIETNILGTANLLEAIRLEAHPCAVVVVTSDKCYENRERLWGYREDEAMGGHDPYSMSKGAAELVTASYRKSFFAPTDLARHGVALATARAGNVIGGGDWAADRIVPDCVKALAAGRPIDVRNPSAVRPWQHVLEPLSGYLLLAARLAGSRPESAEWCEAWNFGPAIEDCRPVRDVVREVVDSWGEGAWNDLSRDGALHEAKLLRLNTEKAAIRLGWGPRWRFPEAVRRTVAWYRAHHDGADPDELRSLCVSQIEAFMSGETH